MNVAIVLADSSLIVNHFRLRPLVTFISFTLTGLPGASANGQKYGGGPLRHWQNSGTWVSPERLSCKTIEATFVYPPEVEVGDLEYLGDHRH